MSLSPPRDGGSTPLAGSAAVEAALRALLPAGVLVGAGRVGEVELDVLPAERAFVARAVAKRREEFLLGRTLARALLRRAGAPDAPLLRAVGRAPCWPAGLTGAIAHTRGVCVVAVASTREFRSLGVDIEPDLPLESELWRRILTEAELRWLGTRPVGEKGRWARFFFSAKESFYKLQHPITATFVEFHAVEVRPEANELAAGSFRASVPRALATEVGAGELSGRYARVNDVLLTAMVIGGAYDRAKVPRGRFLL